MVRPLFSRCKVDLDSIGPLFRPDSPARSRANNDAADGPGESQSSMGENRRTEEQEDKRAKSRNEEDRWTCFPRPFIFLLSCSSGLLLSVYNFASSEGSTSAGAEMAQYARCGTIPLMNIETVPTCSRSFTRFFSSFLRPVCGDVPRGSCRVACHVRYGRPNKVSCNLYSRYEERNARGRVASGTVPASAEYGSGSPIPCYRRVILPTFLRPVRVSARPLNSGNHRDAGIASRFDREPVPACQYLRIQPLARQLGRRPPCRHHPSPRCLPIAPSRILQNAGAALISTASAAATSAPTLSAQGTARATVEAESSRADCDRMAVAPDVSSPALILDSALPIGELYSALRMKTLLDC